MGRKTWDSIGRPLPGRASIVMTRDANWHADGAIAASDLEDALAKGAQWLTDQQTGERRQILFGGGQIYAAGLPYCQVIEATFVDAEPADGVRFPAFDHTDWTDELLEQFPAQGDVPSFSYHRMTRKKAAQPLS